MPSVHVGEAKEPPSPVGLILQSVITALLHLTSVSLTQPGGLMRNTRSPQTPQHPSDPQISGAEPQQA